MTPKDHLSPLERQLVNDGNKIAAIKAYRDRTGVGLAEAKEAVERPAVQRNEFSDEEDDYNAQEGPPSVSLTAQEQKHLRDGNKIEAIKAYRLRTGSSLVDAKNAVEGSRSPQSNGTEYRGFGVEKKSGCFGVVALFLMTSTVVATLFVTFVD
jgi:ribosomal protein L7/L12